MRSSRFKSIGAMPPIDWRELSSLKGANQYTVQNVMQRMSKLRTDPWAGMGRIKQALPKFK